MDRTLSINVPLMFVLSFILSYVTIGLVTPQNAVEPFGMSYIIGRAFGNTLTVLFIAFIPAGIYKLIKKQHIPGFIYLLWTLWLLLSALSTYGSMLSAQATFL